MIKKIFCCIIFLSFFVNKKAEAVGVFNVEIETSSEAINLINLDTGISVYQKNNKKRMFPASLTKIMTYIIVTESTKDFDGTKITVPQNLLEQLEEGSTTSGIKSSETFTVKKLLELMMIPSGNDAALVLAHYFGNGDLNVFIEKMNDKAKFLECEETHFMNPHGLHDENHYTTADDLVRITKYALNTPFFQEIVSKTSVFVKDSDKIPLTTTNKLLSGQNKELCYQYTTGIKTGTTDKGGGCLISSAKKGNQTYMCVVLGDYSKGEEKRFIDSKRLYEWVFNNIIKKQIVDKKKAIGEIKTNYVWKKDVVALASSEDFWCILPKSVDVSSINIKLNAPQSIDAPINAGEKVCTATLSYANQELGTIDVVSMATVERNNFVFFCSKIKEILSSVWFIICSVLFLMLIFSYIILTIAYNRNKERRRNNFRKYKKYKSEQEKHR